MMEEIYMKDKKGIFYILAYRKDDIFRKLTRTDSDSKDYMREMDTTDGSF